MWELLRTYQTNIMFVLSGICGMIALFACITRHPSRRRKAAQLVMALSAMLLLILEILGKYFTETHPKPVTGWCGSAIFLCI